MKKHRKPQTPQEALETAYWLNWCGDTKYARNMLMRITDFVITKRAVMSRKHRTKNKRRRKQEQRRATLAGMNTSSVRPQPSTPAGREMLAKYEGLTVIPSEGPMSMPRGELDRIDVTQELIDLYGPPGIPDGDIPLLPAPVVDALGRVNGQTYPKSNMMTPREIIDANVLRNLAMVKAPEEEVKVRKVTLVKDTTLTYPVLCLKVFVQPDPAVGAKQDEARYAKMFARAQCRRAESVLEADLVVFSGGSDVDPQLYGEKPHKSTFFDAKRDDIDMRLYLMCLENGIPMLGICRGAQFLHVMNGGKLFQDVDGHNGSHSMHDIMNNKHIEKVSSCHHQMVMPNVSNGMEIIATASKSKERWANDKNCFVEHECRYRGVLLSGHLLHRHPGPPGVRGISLLHEMVSRPPRRTRVPQS
jgi:GMP synthase-like glutamine amidotransferase